MTTALIPQTTPMLEFLDRCERLADHGAAQILGVGGNADPATARAAFRALARRFHPDVAAGVGPEDRHRLQAAFARVTEAYQAMGGDGVRGGGPEPAPPELGAAPPPRVEAPPRVTVPARPKLAGMPSVSAERTTVVTDTASLPLAPAPPPPAPPAERRPDPAGRQDRVRGAIEEAQALLGQGDSDGAVRALHQVVTLAEGPRQRQVRLLMARAYLADSRWRRYGISLLREITQEKPPCAEALALLGGVYRSQGLLTRAEATLSQALALDPENPEARSGIRAVRSDLAASRTPIPEPAPNQGLVARLFSTRR